MSEPVIINSNGPNDRLQQWNRTMRKQIKSRREFLASGAGVAATAAMAENASAQSQMIINDPSVVREVEAAFAGYYRAFEINDVAALNGFFYDGPNTVRYGNGEMLYGFAEISSY